MKRIAIPMIGGVITSAVHTLVLIPVYYMLYKRWQQWREARSLISAPEPGDEI